MVSSKQTPAFPRTPSPCTHTPNPVCEFWLITGCLPSLAGCLPQLAGWCLQRFGKWEQTWHGNVNANIALEWRYTYEWEILIFLLICKDKIDYASATNVVFANASIIFQFSPSQAPDHPIFSSNTSLQVDPQKQQLGFVEGVLLPCFSMGKSPWNHHLGEYVYVFSKPPQANPRKRRFYFLVKDIFREVAEKSGQFSYSRISYPVAMQGKRKGRGPNQHFLLQIIVQQEKYTQNSQGCPLPVISGVLGPL